MIGAGGRARVRIGKVQIDPREVQLGGTITLSFELESTASQPQRMVVDYIVHYVKKSGRSSAKVFKLKEFTLGAGETVTLARNQSIRDFTTRVHYPGRHEVEITVNGEVMARDYFELTR